MNLFQPIFFRKDKMGMAVFHWEMIISTRISGNVYSELCKIMQSWRRASNWPPLLLSVCLSWGSRYEMNRQISRGKTQSLAPWQHCWKIKAFRGREEGWSFTAGSRPPDIYLTSPGWEWNWSLGSTLKLSSWLGGGSKELFGVVHTDVHSQLCSIICFTRSSHQGAQPWTLTLQICCLYWAHRRYSPFPGTEFLGCLSCVHQLSKVRHGI